MKKSDFAKYHYTPTTLLKVTAACEDYAQNDEPG
ncbi:hypothetical protein ADUPG1_013176, partial [Aduncisulcus paluster]